MSIARFVKHYQRWTVNTGTITTRIITSTTTRCSNSIAATCLCLRLEQKQMHQHHKKLQHQKQNQRFYHELSYLVHGNPTDVVSYNHQHQDNDIYKNNYIPITADENGNQSPLLLPLSSNSQVLVDMIAAPWNPADVNSIQGRYASPYGNDGTGNMYHKFSRSCYFPDRTVVGSEGWGKVVDIRRTDYRNETLDHSSDFDTQSCYNLKVGDYIAIGLSGFGTMRSRIWLPIEAVIPINRGKELHDYCRVSTEGKNSDDSISLRSSSNDNIQDALASVSTLFQLGGTALRMLQDFQQLQQGDVVVQNAGTSGVGFMLTQLASVVYEKQKIFTVSLIRRGNRTENDLNKVAEHLMTVGKADLVVAEDDKDFTVKGLIQKIQQMSIGEKSSSNSSSTNTIGASLAINAVGGESASSLVKLLSPGKTLVTYGGMSMKPITIGTTQFIFNDIRAVGYWHSRWMHQNSISFLQKNQINDKRHQMINQLVDLLLDGYIVTTPTKGFRLDKFQDALHFEQNQQHKQSSYLDLDTKRCI
jgi:mitochondrial enoyl-[acyl-carrier protein] reductase / trans-2-enoyl-CoA reductase